MAAYRELVRGNTTHRTAETGSLRPASTAKQAGQSRQGGDEGGFAPSFRGFAGVGAPRDARDVRIALHYRSRSRLSISGGSVCAAREGRRLHLYRESAARVSGGTRRGRVFRTVSGVLPKSGATRDAREVRNGPHCRSQSRLSISGGSGCAVRRLWMPPALSLGSPGHHFADSCRTRSSHHKPRHLHLMLTRLYNRAVLGSVDRSDGIAGY